MPNIVVISTIIFTKCVSAGIVDLLLLLCSNARNEQVVIGVVFGQSGWPKFGSIEEEVAGGRGTVGRRGRRELVLLLGRGLGGEEAVRQHLAQNDTVEKGEGRAG